MYYYFYSTANSALKDFFSVFLDREFDVSLRKDRFIIRKPTEANGHSLAFSQQNNSPLQKRHADHYFCVRILNSNIFEGAMGSKGLSGRRSLVIVMCSVGQTFYS